MYKAERRKGRYPLPVLNAYPWRCQHGRDVRKALGERRERIAELLGIDLSDKQGRWQPSKQQPPHSEKRHDFDRYMQVRRAGRGTVVATIDVVLDELEGICLQACAEAINVDRRPSYAQCYAALENLRDATTISHRTISQIDPRVLRILAKHYPGGRRRFSPNQPLRPSDVRKAAARALFERDRPKRGRSPVKRKTLVRFVSRLIPIYEGWSSAKAGRSVLHVPFQVSQMTSKESGPFLEFCEVVFACLPDDVRPGLRRSGAYSLASAVRRALKR